MILIFRLMLLVPNFGHILVFLTSTELIPTFKVMIMLLVGISLATVGNIVGHHHHHHHHGHHCWPPVVLKLVGISLTTNGKI